MSRISIRFNIDIDTKAWADEYGLERREVRDDVKEVAETLFREHVKSLGLLNGEGDE